MRFDYLKPAIGPVVDGLEDHEKIYALEQMDRYLPLRTLPGEEGMSAIYRLELTEEQRSIIADGGDVLVEILHLGGPLAPSRVMVLNQRGMMEDEGQPSSLVRCSDKRAVPTGATAMTKEPPVTPQGLRAIADLEILSTAALSLYELADWLERYGPMLVEAIELLELSVPPSDPGLFVNISERKEALLAKVKGE